MKTTSTVTSSKKKKKKAKKDSVPTTLNYLHLVQNHFKSGN